MGRRGRRPLQAGLHIINMYIYKGHYSILTVSCQGAVEKMFKKRLRQARIDAKLTQQRMADLLGISLNGYQKYEQGETQPPLDTLVKLSHILNVTTDYLLCNDGVDKQQGGRV